jgi:hypothetical protein
MRIQLISFGACLVQHALSINRNLSAAMNVSFVSGVSLPPATRQVNSPHNISAIVMDDQQHVNGTRR